jgi:hypothetical protein
VTERKSTISKTVMPVGQSTRELWDQIKDYRWDTYTYGRGRDEIIDILADADARDPYAVGNLLYAWRTGQLA